MLHFFAYRCFSDLLFLVIDGDRCSLLKDEKRLSLAESLQVLQCLQPCLAQVFPILYAEAQHLLLQHRYSSFIGLLQQDCSRWHDTAQLSILPAGERLEELSSLLRMHAANWRLQEAASTHCYTL